MWYAFGRGIWMWYMLIIASSLVPTGSGQHHLQGCMIRVDAVMWPGQQKVARNLELFTA